MLVLSRKKNESLMLNDDIELTVLDIQGDQVKIGIKAPRDVSIYRKEIYLEIIEENKRAASPGITSLKELKDKIKPE